jgi:hypothetical protein
MECRHLALSTNNIEKISSLTGMDNLKILSLGRNCIKKIENLDGVADTLQQLWMSYNQVEKLVGVDKLSKLEVLYLANNKIKDWSEIDRLSALEHLEDLLLKGCPIYDEAKDAGTLSQYRVEVRFAQHGLRERARVVGHFSGTPSRSGAPRRCQNGRIQVWHKGPFACQTLSVRDDRNTMHPTAQLCSLL